MINAMSGLLLFRLQSVIGLIEFWFQPLSEILCGPTQRGRRGAISVLVSSGDRSRSPSWVMLRSDLKRLGSAWSVQTERLWVAPVRAR